MLRIGSTLPQISVKHMTPQGIEDIRLDEFCQNKKVAFFGVPGAFTPTCHGKHAPSFVNVAEKLKSKGIDAILCLSVNDPFVMDAWGKCLKSDGKVLMLADSSGNATKAMGLEIDLSAPGLGLRCKRFSAIISDGIVEQLFVEENAGTCDITDGNHLLENL